MMFRLGGKSRRPAVVGAIELGTAKIVVLVGECAGTSISVIGAGETVARGMRRGEVVDGVMVGGALGRALAEAERSAGRRVERVFLGLSGAHVEGCPHEGVVRVGGRDGRVSATDIAHARMLAKAKTLPRGRCVLHHLIGGFELDGAGVGEAEGRAGRTLRAGAWHVHGDARRIADSLNQVRNLGLEVDQLILAGLASGTAVTRSGERKAGVLVVDLGAGTTDYALYRAGHAVVAGVVAVGGDHVTNDLSIGLRLRTHEAEALKRRHGRARMSVRKRDERVWLDDERGVGARQLSLLVIEQIAAARTRETLEIVRKKLGAIFQPEALCAGVVLTGGMAEMAGLREVAAEVFGVAVRVGGPAAEVGPQLGAPGYSTAVGVLAAGWELQMRMPEKRRAGFWRRVVQAGDYVLGAGDAAEGAEI